MKHLNEKPITILFDAVPLAQANRTGVGRTEVGIIEALAKFYPNEIELVGHYFDFLGKKGDLTNYLPSAPNIRYRRTVLLPGKVFNMLRRMGIPVFYELLVKERGDFHFFPNFLSWPSLFKTPSAPYVHDITYIDLPEYVRGPNLFDLRRLVPGTLRRSVFAVTNTESSRKGLQKTYPWYKKPFVMAEIPLVEAVTIPKKEADERVKSLGITKPYLLFFGTIEPRKNLVGLLGAYKLLSPDVRNTTSLVISGGKGWKDDDILQTLSQMKQDGYDIIETGYTSNEDRAALFMNTRLYILPSHYEGFGMQLIEAMFYKTPILTSDIPVLREVAQDAALYCATDAASIAQGVEKLMSDSALRENLISRGTKRLADFSWQKVAKNLYTAIKDIVN